MNVKKVYEKRFEGMLRSKNLVWKELCKSFFNKIIKPNASVLDIGCGNCEFLNNVKARRKVGIDLNPKSKEYADKDVTIINKNVSKVKLQNNSFDYVFISNFLEHITREEIIKTLKKTHSLLKKKGKP